MVRHRLWREIVLVTITKKPLLHTNLKFPCFQLSLHLTFSHFQIRFTSQYIPDLRAQTFTPLFVFCHFRSPACWLLPAAPGSWLLPAASSSSSGFFSSAARFEVFPVFEYGTSSLCTASVPSAHGCFSPDMAKKKNTTPMAYTTAVIQNTTCHSAAVCKNKIIFNDAKLILISISYWTLRSSMLLDIFHDDK